MHLHRMLPAAFLVSIEFRPRKSMLARAAWMQWVSETQSEFK